jgi:hypothetical protein
VAVDSKFGSSWGGWCTLEPSRVFGVGLWMILGRVEANFRVIPYLRWEMAPRLDFGMISDVGMWPLRKPL